MRISDGSSDVCSSDLPEVAAGRCGIAPGTIRDLAERFVRARTSACYGRVGTNRGRYSTLTNILIESLNVVAGRFGQPGGWVTGISPIANPDVPTPFPPYGAQRSRIGNFRSEEHTSEPQSLMRSSYAVFCLEKK